MESTIESLDKERLQLNDLLVNKALYSQYLTPVSVARFMASLFDSDTFTDAEILDAGAGIGTLTAAVLERVMMEEKETNMTCTLVEVDEILKTRIDDTLKNLVTGTNTQITKVKADFIEWGAAAVSHQGNLFEDVRARFSHIVLNPPYQKINSRSTHRQLLRQVGIETVNLYTAFVALAIKLLKPGGQLVAIIPRSFCNGPYYKPFRKLLLEETAIRHIHLFASRNQAFKDDDVLQENVIFMLERNVEQGDVKISTSIDGSFSDYEENMYPFERIVRCDDQEQFINIPTSQEELVYERYASVRYTLEDLGITVSTGPVVGFRVKEHLRSELTEDAVPMLYPTHIVREQISMKSETKKPAGIMKNEDTKKWLYPNGYYPIMRRRSSKEETKRIMSAVTMPEMFHAQWLGFDNGVNVLHAKKKGLSKELAYGLHVYMNSMLFDAYFRLFNGHTQVNATDLRAMYFPDEGRLKALGRWYLQQDNSVSQESLDCKIEEVLQ